MIKKLAASALLLLSCAHVSAEKSAAKPQELGAEEAALKDAFGELVTFVNGHPELFEGQTIPICAVLGDTGDPSDLLLTELKSRYPVVEPASSCPYKTRAVLIVAADAGELLEDGRKIAHAGFSLGQHNGMSWAYRLAPHGSAWEIDARLESRNELP